MIPSQSVSGSPRGCSPASSGRRRDPLCRRWSRSARRSWRRRRRRCLRSCRPSPQARGAERHYGNFRWRTALTLGVTSIAGAAAGVQIATALAEDVLRRLFAVLLLFVAAQLAWRCRLPVSFEPWPARGDLASARRRADREHRRPDPGGRPRDRASRRLAAAHPRLPDVRVHPRRREARRAARRQRRAALRRHRQLDELLLRQPDNRVAIAREVRAVAEEIAADPRYGENEQLGPDQDARDRFREFARKLDA